MYPGCHLRELTRGMMLFHTAKSRTRSRRSERACASSSSRGSTAPRLRPSSRCSITSSRASRTRTSSTSTTTIFRARTRPSTSAASSNTSRSRDLDFLSSRRSRCSAIRASRARPPRARPARRGRRRGSRAVPRLSRARVPPVARSAAAALRSARARARACVLARSEHLLTPSEGLDRAACRDREPRAFKSLARRRDHHRGAGAEDRALLARGAKPLLRAGGRALGRNRCRAPGRGSRTAKGCALFAQALLQGAAIRAVGSRSKRRALRA